VLEKPDLPDERIVACLQGEYGLPVVEVDFLPLGADRHTAVYRVVAEDETPYFLKLRRGIFDRIAVALSRFLSDQGIRQIIPPLPTKTGRLWAILDAIKLVLYPFVEGRNGYEVELSDRHWRDLGAAVKRVHTAVVPPALARRLQQETYSPQWRESVQMLLERVEEDQSDDPVAAELAVFLGARRAEILDLVGRAERLARALRARSMEFVLCHSDIHAGNVLIDADEALYIVDWDNPILAPKERDLMFVGGGQGFAGHTPQEEEALFYQGYGRTRIDRMALAYYRYERIVQDIAAFCEQILSASQGGEDRAQSLRYLMSHFLPSHALEIAYKSDGTRRDA
jgi:spectinomycin phosphotransferase